MTDSQKKQLMLRYAQLVFKQKQKKATPAENKEILEIVGKLKLTHEEIMGVVGHNLTKSA